MKIPTRIPERKRFPRPRHSPIRAAGLLSFIPKVLTMYQVFHNNRTDHFISMKLLHVTLLLPFLLTACLGQTPQRIIVPRDPVATLQDGVDSLEVWQIIESQGGTGETGLPQWVRHFFAGEIGMIESMERFDGRYVFIGRNQGSNLGALRQWAQNFCPQQDLAGLIVHRVERRMILGATLYPGDEYGDYFTGLIRTVSNWEYQGAVIEETFWVRRKLTYIEEYDPEELEYWEVPEERVAERFEYLVLISIDRDTLQDDIFTIMANVRTRVPPTRAQTAAINNIRQAFFEGF